MFVINFSLPIVRSLLHKLFIRLFLEELVEYIEQTPKRNQAKFWKDILHLLPNPLCDSFKPKTWKLLYKLSEVQSSLSRIKVVGYDEKLVSSNSRYSSYRCFILC